MTDLDVCRAPACRTPAEPGYAPRGLCPHHETEGLDAVGALHTDWADLQPLIWDKLKSGIGATGGKFGPSEPINYGADALAYEIAHTAVMWEMAVRDRAALSPALRRPGSLVHDDVARAARILTAHYSALLALPACDFLDHDDKPGSGDGVDAVIVFTALHRRARSMVGVTTRTSTVPGVCSVCHLETLRHRDGADDVYCATCHATWTWDEHQDAVGLVPPGSAA